MRLVLYFSYSTRGYALTYTRKTALGRTHLQHYKKANSALGFLCRNLRNCPTRIKISCYRSLVIPILEYACTIWDPHTLKDTNQIEKIQ